MLLGMDIYAAGVEKEVFWKRGFFKKVHSPEVPDF